MNVPCTYLKLNLIGGGIILSVTGILNMNVLYITVAERKEIYSHSHYQFQSRSHSNYHSHSHSYSILYYSSEDLSRRTRESRAELRKYMRKVKTGTKILHSDHFCTANGMAKTRSVTYLVINYYVIMYRMCCTFSKNFGMLQDLSVLTLI